MDGPRIIVDGERAHVRQLTEKLIRPEDGLRPWRPLTTAFYPGGMRVELAPVALTDGGRPSKYLIDLYDYCWYCKYGRRCQGAGTQRYGRVCAEIEVSRLRRQVERELDAVRFTYHPPVYGEEDVNYRLTLL